jgi:hypothetical protein
MCAQPSKPGFMAPSLRTASLTTLWRHDAWPHYYLNGRTSVRDVGLANAPNAGVSGRLDQFMELKAEP